MESREEIARAQGILQQPEVFGHEVGFTDLTRLHGEWIWEMVFGKEDYTLQAHRGSYKSSCLAIAIALRMVIFRRENIIFLRKADNDVSEMLAECDRLQCWPILCEANGDKGYLWREILMRDSFGEKYTETQNCFNKARGREGCC